MSASSQKHSPLEQFEITPYLEFKAGNIDLSITNSSLAMILTVAIITIFLTLTVKTRVLIPSRLQMISEMSYNFIAKLLEDTVGNEGRKYFPFVFTIFMFVLIGNMVGMIPRDSTSVQFPSKIPPLRRSPPLVGTDFGPGARTSKIPPC